jgi:hypothetical protein
VRVTPHPQVGTSPVEAGQRRGAVRAITGAAARAPGVETTTWQAWRAAVHEGSDPAQSTLPECRGRVGRAVTLWLAGHVELGPDGTGKVARQANGSTTYQVGHGHCAWKDFATAPHGFCTHVRCVHPKLAV